MLLPEDLLEPLVPLEVLGAEPLLGVDPLDTPPDLVGVLLPVPTALPCERGAVSLDTPPRVVPGAFRPLATPDEPLVSRDEPTARGEDPLASAFPIPLDVRPAVVPVKIRPLASLDILPDADARPEDDPVARNPLLVLAWCRPLLTRGTPA